MLGLLCTRFQSGQESRLTCAGLCETSGQPERPEHLPSLPKQTPRGELASPCETGSPDPKHLHNQQFQPSRADSSGGKGGYACWGASCPGRMLASGSAGSPKGCDLTRAIVRSSPSCRLPHPHPSALTQSPPAGRSASTAPAEGFTEHHAAFRAQMPSFPSLAPRRPPQKGQPSNLRRYNPGATPLPTPGWRAPLTFHGPQRRGGDHLSRGQGREQGPGGR